MSRQRQYIRLCNAFLAGTLDAEVQYFAASHGIDPSCIRLLVPSRNASTPQKIKAERPKV